MERCVLPCIQRPKMSSNTAELQTVRFDHVISAIRNHDLDSARSLLTRLEADFPMDEDVFMWKAGVARTPSDAVSALEKVLSLNPKNDRALRTLTMVRVYGYEAAAESLSMAGTLLCCKVCALKHAKPFQACSACGSLSDISNLNGMLNNRRTIPRFLLQVVDDLEKRRSPDAAFAAGIGRLNLGQMPRALAQFDHSHERWPSEARFRIWREKLEQCRVVLTVDSSKVVLDAVEAVLGRTGFTVRTALSGEEALRIVEGVIPEAVLYDNAIEGAADTHKAIRRLPGLDRVPFVVMSSSIVNRTRARLTGAAGVVQKPFNAAALREALSCVIDLAVPAAPRSWLRSKSEPAVNPSNTASRGAAGKSRPH